MGPVVRGSRRAGGPKGRREGKERVRVVRGGPAGLVHGGLAVLEDEEQLVVLSEHLPQLHNVEPRHWPDAGGSVVYCFKRDTFFKIGHAGRTDFFQK